MWREMGHSHLVGQKISTNLNFLLSLSLFYDNQKPLLLASDSFKVDLIIVPARIVNPLKTIVLKKHDSLFSRRSQRDTNFD